MGCSGSNKKDVNSLDEANSIVKTAKEFVKKNKLEEGIKEYNKAIKKFESRNSNNTYCMKANEEIGNCYYFIGEILELQKKEDEAIKSYYEAMSRRNTTAEDKLILLMKGKNLTEDSTNLYFKSNPIDNKSFFSISSVKNFRELTNLEFNKRSKDQFRLNKIIKNLKMEALNTFTLESSKDDEYYEDLRDIMKSGDSSISSMIFKEMANQISRNDFNSEKDYGILSAFFEYNWKSGDVNSTHILKLFNVFKLKLKETYKGDSIQFSSQLITISRILGAMADIKLNGLKRETEHDELYSILEEIADNKEIDPACVFLAHYAKQALIRIPNDESNLQSFFRRSNAIFNGIKTLYEVWDEKNIGKLFDAYNVFSEAFEFKEGKVSWYDDIRFAERLIDFDNFIKFESFTRQKISDMKCDENIIIGVIILLRRIIEEKECEEIHKINALKFINELINHKKSSDNSRFISINLLSEYKDHIDMNNILKIIDIKDVKQKTLEKRHRYSRLYDKSKNKIIKTDDDLSIQLYRDNELNNIYKKKELQFYITTKCIDENKPLSESINIDNIVENFLDSNEAKSLLILGKSGLGKSLMSKYIFRKYLEMNTKDNHIIPIYINLPSLKVYDNLIDHIKTQLNLIHYSNLNENKFLIILDGYDEIRGESNLYNQNNFSSLNYAKVIITCRDEYLKGGFNENKNKFIPYNKEEFYGCLQICEFTKNDIEQYLSIYLKNNNLKWTYEEYTNFFKNNKEVHKLVTSPFILSLSIEILPDLNCKENITKKKLYNEYIDKWIKRELVKIDNIKNSTKIFKENRLSETEKTKIFYNFGQEISLIMYQSNKDTISANEIKDLINRNNYINSDIDYFNFMRGLLLNNISEDLWAFVHKSIGEYIICGKIVEEITNYKKSKDDLKYFNIRLLNREIQKIYFIVDFINEDNSLIDKLNNIIISSREIEIDNASSNSMTILNKSGYQFINKDYKNVKVSNADLSNSILEFCDFNNANMMNVNLSSSWINNCNFDNTELSKTKLGIVNIFENSDAVYNLIILKDDSIAATLNNDIVIYDIEGNIKEILKRHSDLVVSLSSSKDYKYLASASFDKSIIIWDIKTWKIFKEILNLDFANKISFSENSKFFASANNDKSIFIWEINTWNKIQVLQAHSESIYSISFSKDNKYLASCSEDRTIIVWDIITLKKIRVLEEHLESVTCLSFSKDGKNLASGSQDGTIIIWDINKWQKIELLKGHSEHVISLSFSENFKYLASCSKDRIIIIWDINTWQNIEVLEGHSESVYSISFSEDCKYLASSSEDKNIILWESENWQNTKGHFKHLGIINSLSLSRDGRLLASGSDDNTILIWDVSTWEIIQILKAHNSSVYSVSFSKDGKYLASGSEDGTTIIWDVNSWQIIQTLNGYKKAVNSVSFSNDGKYLACCSDKFIAIWDNKTLHKIKEIIGHSYLINSISFSENCNILVSCCNGGNIIVWDINTWDILKTINEYCGAVYALSFSKDGKYLASGYSNKTIIIWNIKTWEKIQEIEGHSDSVFSLSFSENGKYLASGSQDRTLIIWDLSNYKTVIKFTVRNIIKSIDNYLNIFTYPSNENLYALKLNDDGSINLIHRDSFSLEIRETSFKTEKLSKSAKLILERGNDK